MEILCIQCLGFLLTPSHCIRHEYTYHKFNSIYQHKGPLCTTKHTFKHTGAKVPLKSTITQNPVAHKKN